MIAVMGASGNTGGEISRRLLADGEDVRVLGRSRERLDELEAAGADVAPGDATDADYLTMAFAGADAVYTLMPYDPTHPDYHAHQHELGSAVAEAIARASVGKVVALSAVGADVAEGTGVIASLRAQEARLRALDGVDVLIVRSGMFYESFYASLEFIAAAGFMGDVIAPDTRVPMVASRDVAAFAARALRSREFSGMVTQELLGPRDLTHAEVAAILGARIGRPGLEYVQMPADEMRGILAEAGLSESFAAEVVAFGEALTNGTIRALGPRDASLTPTTFEEFAGELALEFQPA
jgi:uncharacterized protein YbjT (DUF2867 family)